MGSELLRIADGFSMVADGLRGLAGMEWNGAVGTAEKDADVTENGVVADGAGKKSRFKCNFRSIFKT